MSSRNKASEYENPAVRKIVKQIHRMIHNGIQGRRLHNGSRVETPESFNKLTLSQRERVFEKLDGRFYERVESHVRFKVVWESSTERLFVIISESRTHHKCLVRSKEPA